MGARLQDRVAIVTGGGHGLGRAYGLGLAAEGAKVVIAELDAAAAAQTVGMIEEQGGTALAVPVDVSKDAATQAMARQVVERFGRIDAIVNNAAIVITVPMKYGAAETLTPEEWDRVMAVNLKGVWLCCRAVIPQMKAQGSGKIINISSDTVFTGRPYITPYVAAKAGVIGLTRTLARELGDHNICVNVVAPGLTLSWDPGDENMEERFRGQLSMQALKRIERPEDLVGTIVFLASADSDFITGQTILVSGGGVMS